MSDEQEICKILLQTEKTEGPLLRHGSGAVVQWSVLALQERREAAGRGAVRENGWMEKGWKKNAERKTVHLQSLSLKHRQVNPI